MANSKATTAARSRAYVTKPDQGDLEMAVHAMNGIFWALNMLVVQGAADDIAHEEDRHNGIANLIVAGERLTNEISERF